jgi:hypothetical protein
MARGQEGGQINGPGGGRGRDEWMTTTIHDSYYVNRECGKIFPAIFCYFS